MGKKTTKKSKQNRTVGDVEANDQATATPTVEWVHVGAASDTVDGFLSRPRASVVASAPNAAWGSRKWWDALPGANQGLILLWCAAITLTVIGTGGPRVADAAQQAMFPYTAEGRRQTCADNLHAIYLAAAVYAQDYDERFPVLETKTTVALKQKTTPRQTWVTTLSQQVRPEQFQCPTDAAYRDVTLTPVASYVMNPVLAGRSAADVDDPSLAVFLAEGGAQHDVSLLPPLPTWGGTDKGVIDPNSSLSNLSFRHLGAANVIYADGQAGSLEQHSVSAAPPTSAFWGGSAAMRLALDRIIARNDLSKELAQRLLKGDSKGATSYLRAHRKPLQQSVQDLATLCLLNGGSPDANPNPIDEEWKYSSDKIERLGWTLARTNQSMGDDRLLKNLNRRLALRNASELRSASEFESAGNQPAWQIISLSSGYRIEVPSDWTLEEKQSGQYKRATFRSKYGDVSILCEIGERKTLIEPRTISWAGTESDLKRTYGTDYKRTRMDQNESLLGMEASAWEYEIEKPGGPRLHKLCIGRAAGWNSFVLAFSAPVTQFDKWRQVFNRATTSLGGI